MTFDSLLDESFAVMEDFGIDTEFFVTNTGVQLITSMEVVYEEDNESFKSPFELAGVLMEGMISVFKEDSLKEKGASFHTTADGRLVQSVIASQDQLQEWALAYITEAKGPKVIEIYQEVFTDMGLHCPTCSCETKLLTYEEVQTQREEFIEKLRNILDEE
tara:strand:+ start:2446 stop:2928 length:483 start_codon:yes stop_codon:yes gene_type:complete